jgi:site-specific DNA recombinase
MAVPAIVDKDEFEVVQMLLKSRSPVMVAPRIVSGPTLLTGICFCAGCGGAMTLRTGNSRRYRYYTCQNRTRTKTKNLAATTTENFTLTHHSQLNHKLLCD